MQNPHPFFKLFILGAPLLIILLSMPPAFGEPLTSPTQPEQQFILAQQYHQGQPGIKKDIVRAIYWYEQAATQGHTQAQYRLGHLLCEEYASAIHEFQRGFEWLQKAAEQGESNAQYQVGYIYLEGKHVQKDNKLARHWLELAANGGHVEAKRMLAVFL